MATICTKVNSYHYHLNKDNVSLENYVLILTFKVHLARNISFKKFTTQIAWS